MEKRRLGRREEVVVDWLSRLPIGTHSISVLDISGWPPGMGYPKHEGSFSFVVGNKLVQLLRRLD